MFQRLLQRIACGALIGALCVSAPPAHATLITFTASSPNLGNNGPVDASATITTLANQIDVTLTDLQAGIHSAGQEISGIIITLTVAPSSVSIGSSSGTLIDAPSITPVSGSPSAHWGVGLSSFTVTLETAGPFAHSGQPYDLIIGPGPWPSLNPSITNHQPEIQGTGTFDLTAFGVTSATTVSSLQFLFGTGPDGTLTGVVDSPTSIPEPASLALFGAGLFALGLIRKRRRHA